MAPTSPTQRRLTAADVAGFVRASFGPRVRVVETAPLGGGGFAAVWKVRLDDGSVAVLKVAPPPDVPLLSYETDMVGAEAAYFRLARDAGAPVPRVLHHGDDWLFTSFIEGVPLPDLPPGVDTAGARYDAGAAIARVHRVTGDRYGYTGDRAHGSTWPQAFTAMVEALLADAQTWDVTLPVAPDRIRDAVAGQAPVLDVVRRPALLHFDLWDGNVLATVDSGRTRLAGLVDGERYLHGDPLLDLVSPCLLRRIEDEPDHPFLRGWAAATGEPFVADAAVRRRLALYRIHLYLIMLVEMPGRGMTGSYADARRVRLEPLLVDEIGSL